MDLHPHPLGLAIWEEFRAGLRSIPSEGSEACRCLLRFAEYSRGRRHEPKGLRFASSMNRLSRVALALPCPLLLIAERLGWGGKWLGALAFAAGVGAVILVLSERRSNRTDDPAVLDLRGR
jgi:hypothetical protein